MTSLAIRSVSNQIAATMQVCAVRSTQVSYPTGNKAFAVQQSFPNPITVEESDPFLMCDHFGPVKSTHIARHVDEFPVAWHPHRGMDICTYMVAGIGRHGDSLGNREVFSSPGLQWASVGSGIEHAEAGGTPIGQIQEGFQLWINVPSANKMDDPRYGTVSDLPIARLKDGVSACVVSGKFDDFTGPFVTVQPLLILDVSADADTSFPLSIATELDTTMIYVYHGQATVNGVDIMHEQIALLNANDSNCRGISISTKENGARIIVFAGKKLKQQVAWHGPFVMTTQAELQSTFEELRRGTFPPIRAPFDYKKLSAFPKDHPAHTNFK